MLLFPFLALPLSSTVGTGHSQPIEEIDTNVDRRAAMEQRVAAVCLKTDPVLTFTACHNYPNSCNILYQLQHSTGKWSHNKKDGDGMLSIERAHFTRALSHHMISNRALAAPLPTTSYDVSKKISTTGDTVE